MSIRFSHAIMYAAQQELNELLNGQLFNLVQTALERMEITA
jgi:hypothetical protein